MPGIVPFWQRRCAKDEHDGAADEFELPVIYHKNARTDDRDIFEGVTGFRVRDSGQGRRVAVRHGPSLIHRAVNNALPTTATHSSAAKRRSISGTSPIGVAM